MLNRSQLIRAILISFIVVLTVTNTLSAQERKYERKSVSSLGSVLFKAQPNKEVLDVVLNRLKYHLEIPRFDYNTLSSNAVSEFVKEANTTDLTPEAIASSLNKTIIPKLEAAVSAAAEMRAKGNLKEEDLARAAVDKMKGSGLTVEDLMKVMNSAYLYLPVVSALEEENKEGMTTYSIEGYVLWYQMKKQKDGGYKAEIVGDSKSVKKGYGSGKNDQTYSLKTRSVDAALYSKVIAVNTWAKNLAVTMREIPAFRLSGEVKNAEGKMVEAGLGKKEGLGLDDGYNAIDFYENDNGEMETKELGFFRVFKVEDNLANPNGTSQFKQYFGEIVERGMILYERPKLGIDLTIQPKYFTVNVPRYATPVINYLTFAAIYASSVSGTVYGSYGSPEYLDALNGGHGFILSEDAASGFGVDINFNANMAKLTGVSQLFLNVDVAVGLPAASIDASALAGAKIAPLLVSGYIGPMKKFWFGRSNLNIEISGGVDMLRLQNTAASTYQFDNLSVISPGVKASIGYELLITSDLSIGINAGYKYGLSPILAKIKFKDDPKGEYDITSILSSGFFSGFNDVNFSGVSASIGVSYALPSLSFDPFAFLSSKEIDY